MPASQFAAWHSRIRYPSLGVQVASTHHVRHPAHDCISRGSRRRRRPSRVRRCPSANIRSHRCRVQHRVRYSRLSRYRRQLETPAARAARALPAGAADALSVLGTQPDRLAELQQRNAELGSPLTRPAREVRPYRSACHSECRRSAPGSRISPRYRPARSARQGGMHVVSPQLTSYGVAAASREAQPAVDEARCDGRS